MWGSRPLPEAVTRSTGTGAVLPGSAARSASTRALTAPWSAGFVGPRFEPDEAPALYAKGDVADALQALEQVDHQQAGEVEDEHSHGVRLPPHLIVGPDPGQPVDEALEPAEDAVESDRPPLVDAGHVGPERLGQRQQDHHVQGELEESIRGYEKSSGLRSASTR